MATIMKKAAAMSIVMTMFMATTTQGAIAELQATSRWA
jgi:hypothetical protein